MTTTMTDHTSTPFMSARQGKALTTIATIIGLVAALQSWGILPYQVKALEKRLGAFEEEVKENIRNAAVNRQADRDLIITFQQQLLATQREMQTLRGDISELRSELLRTRTRGNSGLGLVP